MKKANEIFIMSVLILGCVFLFTVFGESQEEELLEKVQVTNIGINVRVIHKGKPVKGLKKEDFKLFVNGKETEIRFLMEQAQKITVDKSRTGDGGPGGTPRLFLLLFNISDNRIDMQKALDPLFNDILRAGDRYLLLSNSFTLNDRLIKDPAKEREKIEHILAVENVKARFRLGQMEMALRTIYDEYKSLSEELASGDVNENAREVFVTKYSEYIAGYKTQFMRLDEVQYLQLANYLKNQDVEKYVLNFFQIGYIPHVKPFSALDEDLRQSFRYLDLLEAMSIPDEIQEKNISKYFLNTGASFHTILMGSSNRNPLNDQFVYQPLPLNSESLFKRITKATGGAVTRSNKVKKFLKKVYKAEDVFYTLFYEPGKTGAAKSAAIKITMPGNDYKLVYDDGKGGKRFQWLVRQYNKTIPQIALGEVMVKNGLLNFPVDNFKMDALPGRKQGKVSVRITVFDENQAKFVVDRKKETEAVKPKLDFKIKLDELDPGSYKIFVEVTDIYTRKNDLGLTRVHITD